MLVVVSVSVGSVGVPFPRLEKFLGLRTHRGSSERYKPGLLRTRPHCRRRGALAVLADRTCTHRSYMHGVGSYHQVHHAKPLDDEAHDREN